MKVLLHICCGPCTIYPLRILREEGHEVTGLFYNPNIHPFSEYEKRKDTLQTLGEMTGLPLIIDETYPIEHFFSATAPDLKNRCLSCYRLRLEYTARTALELGFDAFTSTLLYSRYQNHQAIMETAAEAAARWDAKFLYRDFRTGWKEGIDLSRAMGLYRQKYCGCLFSEKERFKTSNKCGKDATPKPQK